MDEKDFPSSSDESDADFVPEEDCNSGSISEVSDCDQSSEGEDKVTKTRKRKKSNKSSNKKIKTKNEEEVQDEVAEEKNKVDVDALWADFKKDVNNREVKKTAANCNKNLDASGIETVDRSRCSEEGSDQSKSVSNKPKVVPSFSNKNKVGGLSNILSKIGKKDKMSTLQKSQQDWNNFKRNEGIEEEIKLHNRGKDGYLERQDFLERTDLRQFEIEKELRSSRRKL